VCLPQHPQRSLQLRWRHAERGGQFERHLDSHDESPLQLLRSRLVCMRLTSRDAQVSSFRGINHVPSSRIQKMPPDLQNNKKIRGGRRGVLVTFITNKNNMQNQPTYDDATSEIVNPRGVCVKWLGNGQRMPSTSPTQHPRTPTWALDTTEHNAYVTRQIWRCGYIHRNFMLYKQRSL
jgi:hypothetical protein